MSHLLGGGVGYTLYIGNMTEAYEKIGDRGIHYFSNLLAESCFEAQEILRERLQKHGVKSVIIDFFNYVRWSSSVPIVVTLAISEGTVRKSKLNRHVDVSVCDFIDRGLNILESCCGATEAELASLNEALEHHGLEDLEPELYNFIALDYVLRGMTNLSEGDIRLMESNIISSLYFCNLTGNGLALGSFLRRT